MMSQTIAGALLILFAIAPKGHASGSPLQDMRAAAASLTFEMPTSATAPQFDGMQTMALGMGVSVAQLYDMVQNGVTAEGGTCPPSPLTQCTQWLEAQSVLKNMIVVYNSIIPLSPFAHSCAEIGDFAAKVYGAKAAKHSLGAVFLSTISYASKENPNKATLLQGVAVAVYADGSLNKERASKSASAACEGLPHSRH
jgi:hypothetical protein